MKTLKKVGIKGEMFIMPWALYDKEEKPMMSFALLLSVFLRGNIHETTTPLLVRYTNQPVPNANT